MLYLHVLPLSNPLIIHQIYVLDSQYSLFIVDIRKKITLDNIFRKQYSKYTILINSNNNININCALAKIFFHIFILKQVIWIWKLILKKNMKKIFAKAQLMLFSKNLIMSKFTLISTVNKL